MTAGNDMDDTTNPAIGTAELIELAALDALALLDDDERDAFDRAFARATPTLQAQVRREQARIARMDLMLPEVDVPADLRDRVLRAVRSAATEALERELEAPTALRHEGGRFAPTMMPTQRVHPLWRAASIGFATAAVVLVSFVIWIDSGQRQIANGSLANATLDAFVERVGTDARGMLLSDDWSRRAFQVEPGAPEAFSSALAALWQDETGRVKLLQANLPETPGVVHQLVALDDDGNLSDRRITLASVPNGNFALQDIDLPGTYDDSYAIVAVTRIGAEVRTDVVLRLA